MAVNLAFGTERCIMTMLKERDSINFEDVVNVSGPGDPIVIDIKAMNMAGTSMTGGLGTGAARLLQNLQDNQFYLTVYNDNLYVGWRDGEDWWWLSTDGAKMESTIDKVDVEIFQRKLNNAICMDPVMAAWVNGLNQTTAVIGVGVFEYRYLVPCPGQGSGGPATAQHNKLKMDIASVAVLVYTGIVTGRGYTLNPAEAARHPHFRL